MSLTKTGTAWVLLPRPCLYFTSSHKQYLIPSTTSPLKEKNNFCSVLWKKSYFQMFLNGHPLKSQGFHLSTLPKSHRVIRTGHNLLYFCVQLILLTVLEHLLTQPVPSFTTCFPQDTKALSIQMPGSPLLSDTPRWQSSSLQQISATSEKEYLHSPNQAHMFLSQDQEACFPLDLHLLSLSPASLQPLSPPSEYPDYPLRWASTSCSSS